jgi:hypothetical protein
MNELIEVAQQGLDSGHGDVEHLYELSKRRQWNVSELPWEAVDFSQFPLQLRQGLADLIAQTHHGELAALTASARLVQSAPQLMDRLFGATQVTDEARHVEWFSRLLFQLDVDAKVMPAVAALMNDVTAADDLELLVGMNILVEGLAQTTLTTVGRTLRSVELEGLESLKIVGSWLTEKVAGDESRHLAFGINRVGRLVRTLSPSRRAALEARISQWFERLVGLAEEQCRGITTFGIDGDALLARCLTETRSRLALAGLS